ncbi:MAG: S8 family serine peptidase [Deltaproteobacteria bacterium]|nr:S8 family serine peptidase [Deltaproteobacteria bacterium]MBI3295680.1 S8 family serine peptidase [Deltaproteobacteria bacterium]
MGLVSRLLSLALAVSSSAFAASIAVVDSGVDYKHQDLATHMWVNEANPVQTVDVDGTKYVDDLHGWNFAEQNNEVIDYKYLGTFSPDCTKIFLVQTKVLKGTATSEEKAWYKSKKEDQEFLKELGKFGNFVHGTHVSGIATRDAESSRVVAMKLIPTEQGGLINDARAFLAKHKKAVAEDPGEDLTSGESNPLVELFLTLLAQRQAQMLEVVGKYVAATHSHVANGSFGASVNAVIPVIKQVLKQLLGRDPSDEETKTYSIFFVNAMVKAMETFPGAAKDTLFVFAAGNDGTDNDVLPAAPANIKADNVISVAASLDFASLATFSNYGATSVDVAAPGVAILSSIPGDDHLPMSGTSMATPYVTRVGGVVKDANPTLNPAGIKQIIVGTVDVKPFLKGKVSSGGIVNIARAVRAGELSKEMSITAAIQKAIKEVKDTRAMILPPARLDQDLLVLPLPSMF